MFNARKLDYEIRQAGVPIDGCDSNGKVDYARDAEGHVIATAQQIDLVERPVDGIKALHNPNTLLPDDQDSVDNITIRAYLRRQLISAAPDVAAVKIQVAVYINTNPRLVNAHANIANLYAFNIATDAGYLRAALILIALMS
jgi:hypothetical protein